MLGIPALELAPLARLGRQGSRRPDAKGGLHTQDIAQGHGGQRRAEVDAIGGIAQHDTGRQALGQRAADLLQRDLRPKRQGLRDPRRGAANRIHSSGR
jgi:hypothetical protein